MSDRSQRINSVLSQSVLSLPILAFISIFPTFAVSTSTAFVLPSPEALPVALQPELISQINQSPQQRQQELFRQQQQMQREQLQDFRQQQQIQQQQMRLQQIQQQQMQQQRQQIQQQMQQQRLQQQQQRQLLENN